MAENAQPDPTGTQDSQNGGSQALQTAPQIRTENAIIPLKSGDLGAAYANMGVRVGDTTDEESKSSRTKLLELARKGKPREVIMARKQMLAELQFFASLQPESPPSPNVGQPFTQPLPTQSGGLIVNGDVSIGSADSGAPRDRVAEAAAELGYSIRVRAGGDQAGCETVDSTTAVVPGAAEGGGPPAEE